LLTRKLLWLVVLFSVLVVWSHWNLFSLGVVALGINFSLFWVGVALIIYAVDRSYKLKRDWVWFFPIVMIVLSYSLYENPWLKAISLFLLPVILGVFCAYSHFQNGKALLWNRTLLAVICVRIVKPLSAVGQVVEGMRHQVRHSSNQIHGAMLARVLTGICILVPLGLVAILLLSSADARFGDFVLHGVESVFGSISWLLLLKLISSLVLAITLLSIAAGWRGVIEYTEPSDSNTIDGVMAGIVLGGLLIIYLVFLSLQLENLLIEQLPENYREAEIMVKSGFWQLFVLAIMNTGLFVFVYRKTDCIAQWVLRAFIIASSLLMLSAAWKVGLYSYTFGLSYEKYFACYTAIFAVGVLVYLVTASFSVHRLNVLKTIAFAALWGYGIATMSPVEKIIFYGNLHFAEQDNTRITVNQLTQLSLDIIGDVDSIDSSKLAIDADSIATWRSWRYDQKMLACERAWYEFNLSVIGVCR